MLPTVRIGTSHLIERDVRGGKILERLLLCLRATSLLLRATLAPLEMHARCQCEMVETKRRGVPNGAANSVKLTETEDTVDSLAVFLLCDHSLKLPSFELLQCGSVQSGGSTYF
jgi:hypothetical protein